MDKSELNKGKTFSNVDTGLLIYQLDPNNHNRWTRQIYELDDKENYNVLFWWLIKSNTLARQLSGYMYEDILRQVIKFMID